MNSTIKLACQNYDRTLAIVRGAANVPGLAVKVLEQDHVPEMFERMYRGEFDAAEFSLAELVYYTGLGGGEFVGVPVFPSRRFRHGFIFVRNDGSVKHPKDLEGKRFGFPVYMQTACVWEYGILTDDFGVVPDKVSWRAASLQHWSDGDANKEFTLPGGAEIPRLRGNGKHSYEITETALLKGEIDGVGSTRPPAAMRRGEKSLIRLFADPRAVEADYFAKTGIFPVMHVVVAHKAAVERDPDLPAKLFRLFSQARLMGKKWLATEPSVSLAWLRDYAKEEERVFNGDPWTYGLDANSRMLDKFLSYCHGMGITARRLSPRDLFAPSTWELKETDGAQP